MHQCNICFPYVAPLLLSWRPETKVFVWEKATYTNNGAVIKIIIIKTKAKSMWKKKISKVIPDKHTHNIKQQQKTAFHYLNFLPHCTRLRIVTIEHTIEHTETCLVLETFLIILMFKSKYCMQPKLFVHFYNIVPIYGSPWSNKIAQKDNLTSP